jgi:hypothetical protein
MENTKTNLARIEHDIEVALTRPLHLQVEYFFRKRYCLLAVLLLMSVAIIKSDGKFLGIMRDAYNHGYGMIGAYLREEPVRTPLNVIVARVPAIASK